MLAQLQIKFGVANLQRYEKAMFTLKELFEGQGIMLKHGMITSIGRQFQAWNLWEMDDEGHWGRAFNNFVGDPGLGEFLHVMSEIIESETIHFLSEMAFSPAE